MGGRSEKKSSRILKNGSCKLKRGKKKSSLKPSLDQLRLTAVVVLLRPPHLIIGRYTKSFVHNNDLGHKCPSPMNIRKNLIPGTATCTWGHIITKKLLGVVKWFVHTPLPPSEKFGDS